MLFSITFPKTLTTPHFQNHPPVLQAMPIFTHLGLLRPFSLAAALFAFCTLALSFTAGAQQDPKPASKEDVRHLLDTDLQSWTDALPDRRPRLFLSAEQYDSLPQRFQNATGQERKLFDALLARAEQIIQTPLPEYRAPEEMVTERVSLFAAQEELWMREVGDNMVALAIAAQVSNDERFKNYLRDLVLRTCQYPQWGVRPRNAALAAGHILRGIALAYDWHNAIFSNAQKEEIRDTELVL